jgi:hypothetical protein
VCFVHVARVYVTINRRKPLKPARLFVLPSNMLDLLTGVGNDRQGRDIAV